MQIKKTKFKGLLIITNKIYKDSRGYFKEDFKLKLLKGSRFLFSCSSKSKKNVLRGMHIQTKNTQGKFVSVLKGSILDVAIDLRKSSKTFGKYFKIELSDKNGKSVFIPAGFAHGFLALKSENIVHYYNTKYRSAKHEVGINWNDKTLNIKWPIKKPIISKKDLNNMSFKEFKNIKGI